MAKFFKMTHDYNLVRVRKCTVDQQNPFLRNLQFVQGIVTSDNSDDDDEDTVVISISCDCDVFAENCDECPHCMAVAHKLGVIDLSLQLASCGAPRNGIGRKRLFRALEKAASKTRDEKWHLKNIIVKKEKPLWWKGSNVARTFCGVDFVGVVSGYKRSTKNWVIYYSPAPKGEQAYEDIDRDALSKEFALAAVMGVRAVA